jgi:chromosome segregation ATPase
MTDIEILDQAITNMESLQRNLYTFRMMVKRLGDIKTQYDQTKVSVQSIEQQRDDINAQVEAAKDELAKVQKDRAETHNQLATLNREIEAKQAELQSISNAREQIKAMLEAA